MAITVAQPADFQTANVFDNASPANKLTGADVSGAYWQSVEEPAGSGKYVLRRYGTTTTTTSQAVQDVAIASNKAAAIAAAPVSVVVEINKVPDSRWTAAKLDLLAADLSTRDETAGPVLAVYDATAGSFTVSGGNPAGVPPSYTIALEAASAVTESSETIVLAALPADTWTPVNGIKITTPTSCEVRSSVGVLITDAIQRRLSVGVMELKSSTAKTNLQVTLYS